MTREFTMEVPEPYVPRIAKAWQDGLPSQMGYSDGKPTPLAVEVHKRRDGEDVYVLDSHTRRAWRIAPNGRFRFVGVLPSTN